MKSSARVGRVVASVLGVGAFVVCVACGSSSSSSSSSGGGSSSGLADDSGVVEQAGQSCKVATDCYPRLDGGATKGGAVQCLDRVSGGYCTHLCSTDEDCCAVPGECLTGFKQVCAPFESTGQKMCFLSCEDADLHAAPDAGADAAVLDGNTYCATYGGKQLSCRSTGGGKNNRKVCLPSGSGSSDAALD